MRRRRQRVHEDALLPPRPLAAQLCMHSKQSQQTVSAGKSEKSVAVKTSRHERKRRKQAEEQSEAAAEKSGSKRQTRAVDA